MAKATARLLISPPHGGGFFFFDICLFWYDPMMGTRWHIFFLFFPPPPWPLLRGTVAESPWVALSSRGSGSGPFPAPRQLGTTTTSGRAGGLMGGQYRRDMVWRGAMGGRRWWSGAHHISDAVVC